jgi:hypothetical protein
VVSHAQREGEEHYGAMLVAPDARVHTDQAAPRLRRNPSGRPTSSSTPWRDAARCTTRQAGHGPTSSTRSPSWPGTQGRPSPGKP